MTQGQATIPEPSGGGGRGGGHAPVPAARYGLRGAACAFGAALAGSAVLGLPAGLAWGEIAPRALLREISAGTAEVINAETRAFIGADGWFCVIAAVAGVLTGLIGYRLGVARRDPRTGAIVTVGLLLGAVAGTFVMLWLGGRLGLSGYRHQLASSPVGTEFRSSLVLGAKSALAFWPMLTGIVIAAAEFAARRGPDDGADPAAAAPGGYGTPEP